MVAVVICHAQQAVADAIAERLAIEADFSSVTAIVNFAGLPAIVSSLQPDVLVLAESVAAPVTNSSMVDAVALIRKLGQKPAILVVTPGRKIGMAVDAVTAGADGWVAEEAPVEELLDAIRGISEGRVWLSRAHLQDFLERKATEDDSASRVRARFQRLTAREMATLRLLLQGKDGGAIARELGIKTSTVRAHISHVLSKLEVHTTLEVVALARRVGIDASSADGPEHGISGVRG